MSGSTVKKRSKRHQRRHTVGERDGWGCAYCRTPTECGHGACNPAAPVPATLDHVLPKARGGTDRLSNMVISCGPCNSEKGDGDAADMGQCRLPNWVVKRAADPLFAPNAPPCIPRRKHRPLKPFLSELAAVTMVDLVRYRTGRELTTYECPRCGFWHVTGRKDEADERAS